MVLGPHKCLPYLVTSFVALSGSGSMVLGVVWSHFGTGRNGVERAWKTVPFHRPFHTRSMRVSAVNHAVPRNVPRPFHTWDGPGTPGTIGIFQSRTTDRSPEGGRRGTVRKARNEPCYRARRPAFTPGIRRRFLRRVQTRRDTTATAVMPVLPCRERTWKALRTVSAPLRGPTGGRTPGHGS